MLTFTGLLSSVAVGLSAVGLACASLRPAGIVVTFETARPEGVTLVRAGVTHGEASADPWGHPDAIERVIGVLESAVELQNQHIMGWGADNPEPSPGDYQWASLDRRMTLIRLSGGTPVITLCCAPDWMKGGEPGETDWTRLEEAPAPEHYDDFADLAARVARRYPDVKHFQVWNELKGFFDDTRNQWDAESYTTLYNRVYDAVKEVRPDALIGGPYVTFDTLAASDYARQSEVRGPWGVIDSRVLAVVEYWLEHKRGADFVTVDGATTTKAGELLADPFEATQKFAAVTGWLRERTDLPVWWSEFYVQPADTEWSLELQSATMTSALIEMARSGASVALVWQPEAGQPCRGCLWSSTLDPSGGQPTPLARALQQWRVAFPPGTELFPVSSPSPDLLMLASDKTVLIVNRAAVPVDVWVDNQQRVSLQPYEVRYISPYR